MVDASTLFEQLVRARSPLDRAGQQVVHDVRRARLTVHTQRLGSSDHVLRAVRNVLHLGWVEAELRQDSPGRGRDQVAGLLSVEWADAKEDLDHLELHVEEP